MWAWRLTACATGLGAREGTQIPDGARCVGSSGTAAERATAPPTATRREKLPEMSAALGQIS